MYRVALAKVLDPRRGPFWSGHDMVALQPKAGFLVLVLPRDLTEKAREALALFWTRLARSRYRPFHLVIDASRALTQNFDEMRRKAYEDALIEPLGKHCGLAGVTIASPARVFSTSLLGTFAFLHPSLVLATREGLADVLRMELSDQSAAFLGAISSELVPLTVVSRVRAEIGQRPSGTLVSTARRLGLSPRTLQRQLSSAGTTFEFEKADVRLERAREQVEGTQSKIEVIARESGYPSVTHFTAAFKNRFGVPPSLFRRRRVRLKIDP